MGEVFLAEDTRLHRRVALKSLKAAAVGDAVARRRLLQEARTAAQLNHPHIASVYDVVETADGIHVVMEYVEGQTLAERLRAGALPVADVVRFGAQLADALAAAHAAGVVHRDLKPANVMVTPAGDAKILDFGIAERQVLPDPADDTLANLAAGRDGRLIVGTPAYMPPEEIAGEIASPAGDVYSLGVVLYELLTGQRPFGGKDHSHLFQAVLNEAPTPPRALRPQIPETLEGIVLCAMARDPGLRFPTARHLGDALRKPDPLEALETAQLPLARVRSSPMQRVVLAFASLVVLVGAIWWTTRAGGAPRGGGAVPVVALLPFATEGSEATGGVAEATAERVIGALSKVEGMSILSRLTTQHFDRAADDPRAFVRDLGAHWALDGRVDRRDGTLEVMLSLIDARNGAVAWSRGYSETQEGAAFDRTIALDVAAALGVPVTPADRGRLSRVASSNPEALADYRQGMRFLEGADAPEDVERALGLFESAIAKDRSFALPHAGRARAYWELYALRGETEWTLKARESALESLRLDPDQPEVRRTLAVIYAGTGRAEAAIDELRRVLVLQPADDEAHRQLGELLCEQGQWDEGLAALRRAVALRPDYWANHQALGIQLFLAGRYPEALVAFERVTQLRPDSAWGFQMVGTVHHAQGDLEAAEREYLRAIAIAPDARAYSNLGTVRYAQGRFDAALEAYLQAIDLEPGTPAKHRNLGDVYERLGRHTEARRAYERAVTLASEQIAVNPDDGLGHAQLGVYQAKLGRDAEAEAAVRRALELAPDSGGVAYRAAVVEALAGRREAALRHLARALELGHSPTLAAEDEDLEALRDDPAFDALVHPDG